MAGDRGFGKLTKNSQYLTIVFWQSLYTNIPNDEAIQIVLKYTEDFDQPNYPPTIILGELRFILKYNCFTFCNLLFLQVQGTAMGTNGS